MRYDIHGCEEEANGQSMRPAHALQYAKRRLGVFQTAPNIALLLLFNAVITALVMSNDEAN